MVTYDHPEGGLVFSVESLTFGGSLVIDPVLQQIVRNVLAEVATGRCCRQQEAWEPLAWPILERTGTPRNACEAA
jgi:hypothetical protein